MNSSNHSSVDVVDVASFFLRADAAQAEPDVTPLKLQKLVYLAQANYLAWTGSRLFDEPVEAFDDGPVVYRLWKVHSGRQIIALVDNPWSTAGDFPVGIEGFLQRVWDKYSSWSAGALWKLTHEQPPWRDHYKPDSYRVEIPDDVIVDYYRADAPLEHRILPGDEFDLPDDIYEQFAARRFAEGQGHRSEAGSEAARRAHSKLKPKRISLVG